MFIEKTLIHICTLGAWVICEPRFAGSREICELLTNVNHKSKFTEKPREPGSLKFGLHKLSSLHSRVKKIFN